MPTVATPLTRPATNAWMVVAGAPGNAMMNLSASTLNVEPVASPSRRTRPCTSPLTLIATPQRASMPSIDSRICATDAVLPSIAVVAVVIWAASAEVSVERSMVSTRTWARTSRASSSALSASSPARCAQP